MLRGDDYQTRRSGRGLDVDMEWGLDQELGHSGEDRAGFLSTNLGTANAAGLMEPGGNAPGKLAMQFSYSLLSFESINKHFATTPFHISIPSQRNRKEQGRAPGKSGIKVLKRPSTPV